MRLATILRDGVPSLAVVRDGLALAVTADDPASASIRAIAAHDIDARTRLAAWADEQPADAWRPLSDLELGPAVPDPAAIYTIGLNYAPPDGPDDDAPGRPLVYAKLPSAVAGHGAVLTWDRRLTENVDPEVELGVVVGAEAFQVRTESAMGHVFGYTCMNDISSRDAWLDGDQWLLGKSMAGFCPVGPLVVTADELDPTDLRLACAIDGVPIQDGRTRDMRFSIAEIVSFVSLHVRLRPGDLIATGTPARLADPPGPSRHLERGDVVSAWIEGIGELITTIG